MEVSSNKKNNDLTLESLKKMLSKLQMHKEILKNKAYKDDEIKIINYTIKQTKRKIRNLQSVTDIHFKDVVFAKGKVTHNVHNQNIQFRFDEIPTKEIVELLTSSGFKKTNDNKIWRRFISQNSIVATEWILYKMKEVYGNEVKEMSIEEYIEQFDKTFGTNLSNSIKNKSFHMIDFIFSELGERLYSRNKQSIDISKKKTVIARQIEKLNNPKQKQLLDEYEDLDTQLDADLNKQMLIFGFCLCYEALVEMGAIK